MNGAESLLRTLVNNNITTCFTNPGTSEMQFVAAADRVDGMRCVLCLFEGVASGAADGYARMLGHPPATLLHLGPGLANALANFHNAMRANVPIINIVGDHATDHKACDAPLGSDIAAYAKPVSAWIKETATADHISVDTVQAIEAALKPPGSISTLIVPADYSWHETAVISQDKAVIKARPKVDDARIKEIVAVLRKKQPTMILMRGQALLEPGSALASVISHHTGARVFSDTFTTRIPRGAGRTNIERLPYFPEAIVDTLKAFKHLILIGAKPPVGFFAYSHLPSHLIPQGCHVYQLTRIEEDAVDALSRVVDELGAGSTPPDFMPLQKPDLPTGDVTPESIALSISALIPENAIVAEEAISSGKELIPLTASAEPHDWLFTTGGAIGQGLPNAVGAAIACPDRKVLCIQADGSGMYTLQSLWTMARESLNITTIILANRTYQILNIEYQRVGAGAPGPKAKSMLDIDEPEINWVKLAVGMGVVACRVTTLAQLNKQLAAYLAEPGPNLIEVIF